MSIYDCWELKKEIVNSNLVIDITLLSIYLIDFGHACCSINQRDKAVIIACFVVSTTQPFESGNCVVYRWLATNWNWSKLRMPRLCNCFIWNTLKWSINLVSQADEFKLFRHFCHTETGYKLRKLFLYSYVNVDRFFQTRKMEYAHI